MKKLVGMVVLACTISTSFGQSLEPVLLKLKFPKGRIFDMQTQMHNVVKGDTLPNGPVDVSVSMKASLKVLKELPDGSGKLRTTLEQPKVSMGGKPMENPGKLKVSVLDTINSPFGAVKHLSDGPLPKDLTNVYSSLNALPQKPVQVGDSWTNEVPFPLGGNLKIRITLASVETVNGHQVARLIYTGKGDMDMGFVPNASKAASNFDFSGDGNFDLTEGYWSRFGMGMKMNLSGLPKPDGTTGGVNTIMDIIVTSTIRK